MQKKLASLLSLINELRHMPLTEQGCSSAACILDKMESVAKDIDSNSFSAPQGKACSENMYGLMSVKNIDYRALIKLDNVIAITGTEGERKASASASVLLSSGVRIDADISYEDLASVYLEYLRNERDGKTTR